MMISIAVSIIVFEVACQVYTYFFLINKWKSIKSAYNHYYIYSNDPFLGYELKPNYQLRKDGNKIIINKHGIRDIEDEVNFLYKVAILGDSVTFGTHFSQEKTISSILQEKIGRNVKIFNFGVPGYGLKELNRYIKLKNTIYNVDHIIFIMNMNDFSYRNSIYEGADNGLYRMYCQPLLKSSWFIRKAIYRMHKEEKPTSVNWYRWLYSGNKDIGLDIIKEISLYAKNKEKKFTVVILPAGVAYIDGVYVLADIHLEICSFLQKNSITYVNPIYEFGKEPKQYFDNTDHLYYQGNLLMADMLLKICTN